MITDIEEYKESRLPHAVSELICVKCHHRWVAVYPEGLWLKDIHCPNCGPGFVIMTGQPIGTEDE